jgi:hypothetical protein
MDTILFSIFLLVGIRQSIDFLVDEGVLDAED